MMTRSNRLADPMVGFALILAVVTAPGVDERAYADDDDDQEVSETVIVESNRRERRREGSGACGSCGVVTFRIPSPARAENNKGVDYETSRKPNEADAALLFQCASLLEQIQSTSIASWYRPGGKVPKVVDERNALIEQFNETYGDLFPSTPDLGLDTANAAYEYMDR